MSVRITRLEIENVKRVKAVEIVPAQTGLTVIGGKNRQGKTSILDAITYALGGEKYRPSDIQRRDAATEPEIRLTLSNGLIVERKGKNASLKITDPTGAKGGQKLLDSFIEELALNLPKFLAMNSKEKAGVLLSILGIEEQLLALDSEEKTAYDERTLQGRIADQKEKYANELPFFEDAPEEPLTAAALVAESQEIMRRNAERANARVNVQRLATQERGAWELAREKERRVAELKAALEQAEKDCAGATNAAMAIQEEAELARQTPVEADESTAGIEARLAELEEINRKVKSNESKNRANEEAQKARGKYDDLTAEVEAVRSRRMALLNSVKLPLPGLGVSNGELVYNGQKWDCMSGMEQIRVAAAIIRQRKPECGFILLDKLEAFDLEQLGELSEWLEKEMLQGLATRVSTGDECSIIIEDGLVATNNKEQ